MVPGHVNAVSFIQGNDFISMNITDFISRLSAEQQQLVQQIRGWIDAHEPEVVAKMGEMMGADMLMLMVNGQYKYGFTLGKQLTFHNWVMYCHPEIRKQYALDLGVPKSRVKKSCINLNQDDRLDETTFNAMLKAGVKVDWPAVQKR